MKLPSLLYAFLLALGHVAPAPGATPPDFLLEATAQDFDRYFPGYLANGYFSTLTAPRGTEGNFGYMVGLMDYAKDDFSRPAAVPGWTEIDYSTGDSRAGHFWMNQVHVDEATFQNYRQTLDMHEATLTTRYRYLDHGKATDVEVVTFASQADPHLAATRLTLTPDFDGEVELSFALNLWAPYAPRLPLGRLAGDEMQEAVAAHGLKLEPLPPAAPDRAALWYRGTVHVPAADGDAQDLSVQLDGRAEQGLAMAEAAAVALPPGLRPVEAKLHRDAYRLALDLRVVLEKGKSYTFSKFVALSRAGWGGDAQADLALARAARARGFDLLLGAHRAAWSELWRSDIAIDGDERAQRAVHSDLYYLLSTSTADTAWPMGACALTPGYAGHTFWDSDTWIFPALLLLHPQRAKSLVNFRAHTLDAAQARADARGWRGAMYPWEADPENGSEQTPHFAWILGEREIHVNADVAIAQYQYWLATRDRAWLRERGWPVIRNVAEFWASRASWNATAQRYEIHHVTSVDEDYNDVPNDTFTNLSAAKALRIATELAPAAGARADPHWREVADAMQVPFSSEGQHHLEFDESVPHDIDTWGGSSLPMLSLPSLDAAMSAQVRRNDYERALRPILASHHDPNSMGLAPMSISAAINGDLDNAVRWLQGNFTGDVLKGPFNVRTETARNNTGYFVTASAGFLQNLVYGFTGLRIEDKGLVEAYPPMLPPSWTSLTLKRIAFRGAHYDIRVERRADGHVQLRRSPSRD
ncbi:MAG TPA: glycoside hydrolase family 65 protein [Dokdonella sp.]